MVDWKRMMALGTILVGTLACEDDRPLIQPSPTQAEQAAVAARTSLEWKKLVH